MTFGARGRRMDSLRENGLHLHSDLHGEISVRPEHVLPACEIGPQDYIFICVKNYSLEEACRELSSAVDRPDSGHPGHERQPIPATGPRAALQKRDCHGFP